MYSERRKADRKKMIEEVAALARRFGWGAEVDYDHLTTIHQGRCTSVEITGPRGVSLFIDFNGQSTQPDVFVCTWNLPTSGPTVSFSKRFEGSQRTQPYGAHFKATRVWKGWDVLILHLKMDLEAVADGSAFDDTLAQKYDGHVQRGEMPWQIATRNRRPAVASAEPQA